MIEPIVETEIGVFADENRAWRAVNVLESHAVPAERIGVVNDPHKAREVVGTRVGQFLIPMTILGAVAGVLLLLLVPAAAGVASRPSELAPWLLVGALGGLVTGALLGKVVPRHDAGRYERRVEQGAVLLTVHCRPRECLRVQRLLADAGAENLAHERTAESP